MKSNNCGNCPHLHRCFATNDDECIDTILCKRHFISDREKQIRSDAIEECIDTLKSVYPMWKVGLISKVIEILENLKGE